MHRQLGVTIPKAQRETARAHSNLPAQSVVQIVPMQVYGVGIVNREGEVVSTVAYRIGSDWWTDPNGEDWLLGLLRARSSLNDALNEAVKESSAKVDLKGVLSMEVSPKG